jgi:threonine/homoserine efflux transporter RhtA
MEMIPWYRQLLSLVYGIGVMLIALWALEQGSGPWVILGVVGMSMLTLTLIFGVEIDSVQFGNKIAIEFTDTSDGQGPEFTNTGDDDDNGGDDE